MSKYISYADKSAKKRKCDNESLSSPNKNNDKQATKNGIKYASKYESNLKTN